MIMHMRPECVPCQLKRALYEASLVPGSDPNEVMQTALRVFNEYYPPPEGMDNNEVSSMVKEAVYRTIGSKDPQWENKRRSNKVALGLLPVVERMIAESDDPLGTAVLAAVVGNVMDFGIKGSADSPEHLSEIFHTHFEEGLFMDNTDLLRKRLSEVDEVLYMTDNAGEIVFDILLIRELKKMGKRVVLMVRGEPILNDATLEDVEELALEKEVDRVTTTGHFGVGIAMGRAPQSVKDEIFGAQLIIAKGMGNYEGFADLELPPLIHLMRTKCQPVADDIGYPYQKNIAHYRD